MKDLLPFFSRSGRNGRVSDGRGGRRRLLETVILGMGCREQGYEEGERRRERWPSKEENGSGHVVAFLT